MPKTTVTVAPAAPVPGADGDDRYGEVTGVTQTVLYFSSSLGLAVLGTVFVNRIGGGAHVAQATQTVYRSMAGVMVGGLMVAILGMRRGRVGDA